MHCQTKVYFVVIILNILGKKWALLSTNELNLKVKNIQNIIRYDPIFIPNVNS